MASVFKVTIFIFLFNPTNLKAGTGDSDMWN